MKLSDQAAKPIVKGMAPLSRTEAETLIRDIPAWKLEENSITREYRFRDFREAIDFVYKIAAIADEQDHHPDIFNSYNKVKLTLSTHKIGGLSMNDFIVAAKIDLLVEKSRSTIAA